MVKIYYLKYFLYGFPGHPRAPQGHPGMIGDTPGIFRDTPEILFYPQDAQDLGGFFGVPEVPRHPGCPSHPVGTSVQPICSWALGNVSRCTTSRIL